MNKAALFLFALALCAFPFKAESQISQNPVSMGLGGGGTSYITGYDALFINPANLQLREKEYRYQFSILEGGFYMDTPLRIRNGLDRFDTFTGLMQIPQESAFRINDDQRNSLLARHYPGERLSRQFRSVYSINWFGMKWFGDERSYALALRTRQSSRYTVGRGYYDSSAIEKGDVERVDRSLSHDFQTLHEISFGYSESYTFLSGLFPRISRFIVGIAPKIVVSGPSFSTDFNNIYSREEPGDPWVNESSYRFQSTGVFTNYAELMLSGSDPLSVARDVNQVSDLMNPTGIGAAIDLGITYIFTYGSDLSLIRRGEEPTEKSLRISLSLTDLGVIHYFDDPFRAETENNEPVFDVPGPVSDTYFSGALLQDFRFLQNGGAHPLQTTDSQNRETFRSMLPTSIQSGILFQMNRLKVTGDFQLGLQNNAFQSTKLSSFVGIELRPLSFLPLRAGTRLATDLPGYYSFGAGLETRYFDLNAGVQFRSTKAGPTREPVAASAVALKFYIPW